MAWHGAAVRTVGLLLAAGILAMAGSRWWLDHRAAVAVRAGGGDELAVPAEALRRLDAGFGAVLADWYWVRTLLYVGAEARRSKGLRPRQLRELAGLLRKTVALDSRHLAAWRFGGIFLSEVDPEEGLRFVAEGARHNPAEWRLVADEAFILWRMRRYRESAQSWQKGAQIPGAPAWLEPMAAIVRDDGGERETAREIFRRLLETTEDRFVREVCLVQLERLERTQPGTRDEN